MTELCCWNRRKCPRFLLDSIPALWRLSCAAPFLFSNQYGDDVGALGGVSEDCKGVRPGTFHRALLRLRCFFGAGGGGRDRKGLRVELDADAIAAAQLNLREHNLPHGKFISGDAARSPGQLPLNTDHRTLLLVDPPRGGVEGSLLEALNASPLQWMVYVSCAPDTLGARSGPARFGRMAGGLLPALRSVSLHVAFRIPDSSEARNREHSRMNEKKLNLSPMDGHRERLRAKYLKAGHDGMLDYEKLELLLTFVIARRDVSRSPRRCSPNSEASPAFWMQRRRN